MRNYKRKRLRVDPDKRMAAAVRLRTEGLSLRQIAERLVCTHTTVRRDLARWDAAQSTNVVSIVEHSAGTSSPPRGRNVPPKCSSGDSSVVAISDRRKPHENTPLVG